MKSKLIEGFENYTIFEDGRVYSKYGRGRFLKPKINKDGYLQVTLRTPIKNHIKLVHKLVFEAFTPNLEVDI